MKSSLAFLLGQIEDNRSAVVVRQPLGAALGKSGVDFRDQCGGFILVSGDVDQHDDGHVPRRRLNRGQADFAARHAVEIVPGETQAFHPLNAAIFQLALEILDEIRQHGIVDQAVPIAND